MGSVGAPLLLPLPRAGSQPSLPSDHQPGIHGLITKIATLVGQAQPALAKHPFAEDTSSKNFFFNVDLSEQVQRRKEEKWGWGDSNNGFLFPSWGWEGDPVGCLSIPTQTMKTHLEAQSQVRLVVQWSLLPNEVPENLISSRKRIFGKKKNPQHSLLFLPKCVDQPRKKEKKNT